MTNTIIYKIKKRPYFFFFVKLIILLFVLFIMDFAMGGLLNKYYFKLNRGAYYRTTYSMDSTKAAVLIFGSSRANHHYSPDILESRLNVTCYNAGRDAGSIFYHYAVLKAILNRYSPKIVILDLHNDEFLKNQDSYDRISSLLPYYRSHPEIRSIVELRSPYEKYKLISRIYPFNSLVSIIASGNALDKKRDDIKGYLPLTKTWNEPIKSEVAVKFVADKNKLECYENFIKDCKRSGSSLYIFVSPRFIKSGNPSQSIILGQGIAKKYSVKFYDYSRDTLFSSHISMFADEVHLNVTGTELFTNMITDKIINDKY